MRNLRPWLYCLPAALVLAVVAGYPLFDTLRLSFTDARLGGLGPGGGAPHAIGLANYRALLADPDAWRAVGNTVVFAVASVLLETAFGLGIALLLHQKLRGRALLRAAVLVPWAIPAVVSAKIWAWMFNDLYGIVNRTLLALHLVRAGPAWLADDRLALVTLVIVDVWKTTPFVALLLLAGLQSIPANVEEAARLDGASPWSRFFRITLPLLRPALLVAMIFRTLDALRIFDLPFVLTSNSRATATLGVFARQQLVDFQDAGYGSACSFLTFSVVAIFAFLYIATGRKQLGFEA